jgi:hypothetical protein
MGISALALSEYILAVHRQDFRNEGFWGWNVVIPRRQRPPPAPRHVYLKRWGSCDPRTINSYTPNGTVWVVTFAGWSQRRKEASQTMVQDIRMTTFPNNANVNALLFTEDDLPEDYYQEFSWAFAKKHYRGFWTWKPWILRNLTETKVFQENDLVFWVDSDEQFFTNKTYFRVALCDMEHRNDNYAGVFPFERCFGHEESQYTKPDAFERIGTQPNDNLTQGEQIYAGSFGFRINDETLGFLLEWEMWGHDPVMFGNDRDFPGELETPSDYKQHKNDQSVFSLMVRSRQMKTWPAPYYWYGDTGFDGECYSNFLDAGYCFFFRKDRNEEEICEPFERWLNTLPAPILSNKSATSRKTNVQ